MCQISKYLTLAFSESPHCDTVYLKIVVDSYIIYQLQHMQPRKMAIFIIPNEPQKLIHSLINHRENRNIAKCNGD
jgi:hypothetical protein